MAPMFAHDFLPFSACFSSPLPVSALLFSTLPVSVTPVMLCIAPALLWTHGLIIESAEKRKKKNKNSFSDCLVSEILEALLPVHIIPPQRPAEIHAACCNSCVHMNSLRANPN